MTRPVHCSNGAYNGVEYFKCQPGSGLFLPCNKLRFRPAPENAEAKPGAIAMRPVKVGDTVGFYLSDVFTRGIVMAVYKEESTWMVKVCPVRKWSYLRLLQEMWMSLPPPPFAL